MIPRRSVPLLVCLALLVTSGCAREDASAPGGSNDPGAARGFNLLLITIDTLRADRLGCYGNESAVTPAIDALADRGVRFEQAVCGAPVTLPSHTTIMTGLDVPRHGVRHNGTFRLGEEHLTLAEVLHAEGYRTGAFIGSFVLDARYGLAQGFDRYDDDVRDLSTTPSMGRFNERPAAEVVDAAMEWLDETRSEDAPFMTWVHLFDPHMPYEPPAEFAMRFADRPYEGEIAYADAQIGRMVEFLAERGELERTLIVLTADHGEGLGEHGELTHTLLIYDGSVRVPLILSNPRLFPEARVVTDRLAGGIDLFPTVLTLLGVSRWPEVDGRDLFAAPLPDRAIYVESLVPWLDYGWAPLRGLRRLQDKLIRAPTPEYYVVATDPGETENRYASSERAERLEAELDRRMEGWPSDLTVAEQQLDIDEEALERLASLGYLRAPGGAPGPGLRDPKEMMDLWETMHRAGELSLAGEHDAAIELIGKVIEADPTSGKTWYTALRIYDRAGREAEAEQAARRAVALSPSADGWVVVARYALNRQDWESFEQALNEVERLDPQHGGLWIGRGHRLAMEGRLLEAREAFQHAIEVDPSRSGAHARQQIARIDALLAGR